MIVVFMIVAGYFVIGFSTGMMVVASVRKGIEDASGDITLSNYNDILYS